MGILSEIERRLGGAIEGIFAKAFRTGLQPVELARRILKEMEANKRVGVREVWVPNGFVFSLSPPDRETFQQTEKALRRELEQVIRDGALERGWSLVGPAEVEFETDPSLKEGEFLCQAVLVEGPTPPPPPPASSEPAAASGEPAALDAELVLIEDGRSSDEVIRDVSGDVVRPRLSVGSLRSRSREERTRPDARAGSHRHHPVPARSHGQRRGQDQ